MRRSLSAPTEEEYVPHGDTNLRAVKQFEPEALIEGFDQSSDRLLSAITKESFRQPMTAAIDITTILYSGDVEDMSIVSGAPGENERAFKFATLSVVGETIPLILAIESIRESSAWDDNQLNQLHRVVRRLVQRAKEHVPIETVLCDRDFDSMDVFQTLPNVGATISVPNRSPAANEELSIR